MNLVKYRFKVSHLEYYYNIIMVINVVLMLSMAACLSLANYSFNERVGQHSEYISYDSLPIGVQSLGAFLSFYLILNSFIPLEVPVMVELSKFMATYFIEQDAYMMKPNKYNKGEIDQLKVQTMNLHEELGEISFIFCDKTGTLTKNELVFSHLSV